LIGPHSFPKAIHYNRLNMAEDKASLISIDYNGDTLLEVSCPEGKTLILLSSKVLTLASPVFAAMFKSHFKEGLNNHSKSAKSPIPLLDDNAKAVIVLSVWIA